MYNLYQYYQCHHNPKSNLENVIIATKSLLQKSSSNDTMKPINMDARIAVFAINQQIYLIYTSLQNILTLIMLSTLFLIQRSYSMLEATNDFVLYYLLIFAK